jgi:hypothetical protein
MFTESVMLLATWNVTDANTGKNISTTHLSFPHRDANKHGARVQVDTLLSADAESQTRGLRR